MGRSLDRARHWLGLWRGAALALLSLCACGPGGLSEEDVGRQSQAVAPHERWLPYWTGQGRCDAQESCGQQKLTGNPCKCDQKCLQPSPNESATAGLLAFRQSVIDALETDGKYATTWQDENQRGRLGRSCGGGHSHHKSGQAWDYFCSSTDKCIALVDWLLQNDAEHAHALGVMYFIYELYPQNLGNCSIWRRYPPTGWSKDCSAAGGSGNHHDHVHVAFTKEGAAGLSPGLYLGGAPFASAPPSGTQPASAQAATLQASGAPMTEVLAPVASSIPITGPELFGASQQDLDAMVTNVGRACNSDAECSPLGGQIGTGLFCAAHDQNALRIALEAQQRQQQNQLYPPARALTQAEVSVTGVKAGFCTSACFGGVEVSQLDPNVAASCVLSQQELYAMNHYTGQLEQRIARGQGFRVLNASAYATAQGWQVAEIACPYPMQDAWAANVEGCAPQMQADQCGLGVQNPGCMVAVCINWGNAPMLRCNVPAAGAGIATASAMPSDGFVLKAASPGEFSGLPDYATRKLNANDVLPLPNAGSTGESGRSGCAVGPNKASPVAAIWMLLVVGISALRRRRRDAYSPSTKRRTISRKRRDPPPSR